MAGLCSFWGLWGLINSFAFSRCYRPTTFLSWNPFLPFSKPESQHLQISLRLSCFPILLHTISSDYIDIIGVACHGRTGANIGNFRLFLWYEVGHQTYRRKRIKYSDDWIYFCKICQNISFWWNSFMSLFFQDCKLQSQITRSFSSHMKPELSFVSMPY